MQKIQKSWNKTKTTSSGLPYDFKDVWHVLSQKWNSVRICNTYKWNKIQKKIDHIWWDKNTDLHNNNAEKLPKN